MQLINSETHRRDRLRETGKDEQGNNSNICSMQESTQGDNLTI